MTPIPSPGKSTVFSRQQAAAILLLQGLGLAIWYFQNGATPHLGGPISIIKAYWLAYAITLWLVVPFLLLSSHAFPSAAMRRLFLFLAVSMAIRAAVEAYLCATIKWSVRYGLAHDLFHAGLLLYGLLVCRQERPSPARRIAITLLLLTLLSLATEALFVHWFFQATSGPANGVYFVPGGDAFRAINRKTAAIFLPQYAIFIVLFLSVLVQGRHDDGDRQKDA